MCPHLDQPITPAAGALPTLREPSSPMPPATNGYSSRTPAKGSVRTTPAPIFLPSPLPQQLLNPTLPTRIMGFSRPFIHSAAWLTSHQETGAPHIDMVRGPVSTQSTSFCQKSFGTLRDGLALLRNSRSQEIGRDRLHTT